MKITGKIYLLVMILCIAGILYSCNRSLDNAGDTVFTESLIAEEGSVAKETKQQGIAQETISTYVTVHICGAVKKPGVYKVPVGSRYAEALQAAGGITKDGAADYLNLACIVNDGEKLYVPYLEEVEDPYGRSEVGTAQTAQGQETISANQGNNNGLININTATVEELQTLNGIGETRANAIITYRQSNSFTVIEDIMLVPGIKEGAFAKIKDYITV